MPTLFVQGDISGTENTGATIFQTINVSLTLNATAIQSVYKILRQMMMMYPQTRFGCKRISSSEDILEMIIFWLYEPSLWSWPWRWQNNLSTRQNASWWCIIILYLVTRQQNNLLTKQSGLWWCAIKHQQSSTAKGSEVHKIEKETDIFWLYETLLWLWPWE